MARKVMAVCLAMLLWMAVPAFAGESVDSAFLTQGNSLTNRYHLVRPDLAFLPLPVPQAQPAQPAQPAASSPKKITTAGKVMIWTGVGLIGVGTVVMAGAASCSGLLCNSSNNTVKNVGYGIGGVGIGLGAVLVLVGIHHKK